MIEYGGGGETRRWRGVRYLSTYLAQPSRNTNRDLPVRSYHIYGIKLLHLDFISVLVCMALKALMGLYQ